MAARWTSASEAALVGLFQGKRCCNVTFAVDTSDATRAVLGSVKRLLIQTLLTKASLGDSLFNMVTFSGQVNRWSQHMLPCAPDTVRSALSWVHSISCSPGRDLLAALGLALSDPACQSVHVLCVDLPEQPEALLRALPALAAGRPVTFFYLQRLGQLSSTSRSYLQCLSHATGGGCYVVPVGLNEEMEKVVPVCVAGSQSSVPPGPVCCCCPSTSLRCIVGNPLRPTTSCVLPGQTQRALEVFPGCRVLARRQDDGFYHLGNVTQQVQSCTGAWVVEFDPPSGPGLDIVSSHRQLVCSLDMVNYSRVHPPCLVPGDPVLSPWEPDLRRYGPGRVIAATGHREFGVDAVTSVRVLMWNGCVSLVPASLVLPISASHHDRLVRELQIPACTSARHSSWAYSRPVSCGFCSRCSPWSCSCPVTSQWPSVPPRSSKSSPERTDGAVKAEPDLQTDPEASSSPPSPVCENDLGGTCSPAVKLRRQPRPPWRYWRRTGSEPQHRQPGSVAWSRTPRPGSFSFPAPQISASPNHSSLFQSLPGSKGRRVKVRDILGMSDFTPQLLSGNEDATVCR
ncbi:uncharacterized protein C11orf16 homolog [Betta splendens]|uniref:Uncharacterized protein C11orf16 homolog n=1 Tax=Betta splendens TaxID=158456 RepID=A0A6P7MYR8_BETSP|nr:uncharacterized protein C11orf16 homolog [Betta splendens]